MVCVRVFLISVVSAILVFMMLVVTALCGVMMADAYTHFSILTGTLFIVFVAGPLIALWWFLVWIIVQMFDDIKYI